MRNTLFFLLLVISSTLSAQTFRASLIGGVNMAQIDGDSLIGFRKYGVNAGMRVVAVLSEQWRVGPEILFSQQGARQENKPAYFSSFKDIRINAVEVPLMVYFKEWRFTAEAGASFNRVFSTQITDWRDRDETELRPLKQQYVSVKVGATYYFTPNLGLNVRWSKSLSDLTEFPVYDFRSRYLSIRAVYTLGAGELLPDKEE